MNLKFFFLFGILSVFAGSVGVAESPNVIVILADDLGCADVGFNGCKDIPTPNIDSLAKRGVRFSNGYVSHAFCSPTRAGLMTGRYQQRFGHESNPAWDDPKGGLPVTETFLVKQLQEAGYVTGAMGKWHLGNAPYFHPNERGFTEYYGFLGGGHQYMPELTGTPEYTAPILRNKEPVPFTEYMTDQLSREAVAFIARHKGKPFFLYLAYNAVHTPLQAPEKYLSRFSHIADERRRTYAAMTSAMDDGVGAVLQALRENKLEQNTLVFFLSDNGGPAPSIAPTDNTPFRGHKGSMYEGGIHVPFVACWPGRLTEGMVYDQPVISLDVLPTALALAGAKLTEKPLDGVNLMPYLLGENKAAPHERLYWRQGGGEVWAIREGRYKLVLARDAKKPELYDLETDISETKDLAGEKPELAQRLAAVHAAWNTELIPPAFEGPKKTGKKKTK